MSCDRELNNIKLKKILNLGPLCFKRKSILTIILTVYLCTRGRVMFYKKNIFHLHSGTVKNPQPGLLK